MIDVDTWQLMRAGMTARLVGYAAADLPAGSTTKLAHIMLHCHTAVLLLYTEADPDEVEVATGASRMTLASKALTAALIGLGKLHEVLPSWCRH
jgi:hypothetical protein